MLNSKRRFPVLILLAVFLAAALLSPGSTVTQPGVICSGTAGSVFFASGPGCGEDNATFFWDNTEKRFQSGPRTGFNFFDGFTDAAGYFGVLNDVSWGLSAVSQNNNAAHTPLGGFVGVESRNSSGVRGAAEGLVVEAHHTAAGTVTDLRGIKIFLNPESGTVTNSTGLYLTESVVTAGTNHYGIRIDDYIGATNNWAIRTGAGLVDFGDRVQAPLYSTTTNCADSAGDAACGAAPAGAVVVDAADTTTVVSTTAVTANSEIFLQEDSSLNARLSVTCNTTIVRVYTVTARTAVTSFTVTASAAPVTNPACLNYKIVN